MDIYINRNGVPVKVTFDEYMNAWQGKNRSLPFSEGGNRVASDDLPDGRWLSTVFLNHDHNFGDSGPPILFETILFQKGSYVDERCERYSTVEEALSGHARILAEELAPNPGASHAAK